MIEKRLGTAEPSTRSSRWRLEAGSALLLSLTLMSCGQQELTPALAASNLQLEAEAGTIQAFTTPQTVADPRNGGRIINDPAASGGKAVILLGTNDNVRFVVPGSVKAGRYTVSVRGKGENYQGWPTVDLNDERQRRLAVATLDSATYVTRKFGEFDLKPGQVFNLSFINDLYEGRGKDRNAIVDYLVIEPVGTTPTPPANQAPTVTLRPLDNGDLPTPGVLKYNPGHNVTLEATASDPDGSVARVEFYLGSQKIGEDTTAPYRFVYSTQDSFDDETEYPVVFSARAVDNLGATASTQTSQTNAVLGADLGNDGRSITYQPLRAINLGGPAVTQDRIVYAAGGGGGLTSNGTANVLPADRALVPPVTDPDREAIVRSAVSGAGPLALALPLPNTSYNVYLYVHSEDATPYEVQMEGRSVARFDPGEAGRWDKLGPFPVSVGDGVLNVATTGTAAASFSAIEVWRRPQAGDTAPTVSFNPVPKSFQAAGQDLPLSVDASDADGIAKVEFYLEYAGSGFQSDAQIVKIGEATTAPYNVVLKNPPSGPYNIVAQATDKTGLSTRTGASVFFAQSSP
ncbi:Ig-like domain-containing protein [Deinococcus aestuarii]|uniref:Ig-like domain-containing protein n=1 Tax=Deinococcus aestuarii TaxID=2774531 RepID=UPI001C0CE7F1|nr:Ig-like domain-containing protein [Deinococcus aestuarii]